MTQSSSKYNSNSNQITVTEEQKRSVQIELGSNSHRVAFNPVNLSGRQSPLIKRTSNAFTQRNKPRPNVNVPRPITPIIKKDSFVKTFVQIDPSDLFYIQKLMEFTAEKKQTSTETQSIVTLEDILSRQKIVTYTLTTNNGELRYVTCLVCLILDTSQRTKFVLQPVVFCILTISALFKFSIAVLKQLFSLTVFPSQARQLQSQQSDDKVLPLEFHIWLLFYFFQNQNLLVQQYNKIKLYSDSLCLNFLHPNLNFDLLKIFDREQLIQLFSCFLLEYKVVFILSESEGKPQLQENDMANLFECLLQLVEPVDKHIFTQVPFMYTEDLCMLIQKPGSLICSISEELWKQKGAKIFSEDPEFFLIMKISNNQVQVLTQNIPRMPETIEGLLYDSLNTASMSSIQHQVTLKQAFYNALLLTCMMVQGDEGQEYLQEFCRTMCYIDLMERIEKGLLPTFAQSLKILETDDKEELFQSLIDEQGKQIAEQLTHLNQAEGQCVPFQIEKLDLLKSVPFRSLLSVDKTTLQHVKDVFSRTSIDSQKNKTPRKIQDVTTKKPRIAKQSSMKFPVVGDFTIKEQQKVVEPTQVENKSFFTMVTDFFSGVITNQPQANQAQMKTLYSQYSDTEVVSQNKSISSLESSRSDETPRKVASENKGRIRVDLGRQADRQEMPFEIAATKVRSQAQLFEKAPSSQRDSAKNLIELPKKNESSTSLKLKKFPSTLSFRQLPASSLKVVATKPRQKNAKVVKKTNINLQLLQSNSLNLSKNELFESVAKQDTTALRLQQIIKRATLNQTAPQNFGMPQRSSISSNQAKPNQEDLKTPPKKTTKVQKQTEKASDNQRVENQADSNLRQAGQSLNLQIENPNVQQMNQTLTIKHMPNNPQTSLSPRVMSSGHLLKQFEPNGMNRPKALSQFQKKDRPVIANLSSGAKVIKTQQVQPAPSTLVLQKIRRLEGLKNSEKMKEIGIIERNRSASNKASKSGRDSIQQKPALKFVVVEKRFADQANQFEKKQTLTFARV